MKTKYYRDLENEKEIGEFVTTEDLFKDYYSLCLDGSIDPVETSFSDFLVNADESWGGTLREVDLDNLKPRYMTYRPKNLDLAYTRIICIHVPSVFSDAEVEAMLEHAFLDAWNHGEDDARDVLESIAKKLHGYWVNVDSNVGSYIL